MLISALKQRQSSSLVGESMDPSQQTSTDASAGSRHNSPKGKIKSEDTQSSNKSEQPNKAVYSKEKTKRKGGFAAPRYLSPKLAAFVGVEVMGRTEVVKSTFKALSLIFLDSCIGIWKHVKANNLQDPRDGRVILCDDSLSPFLGKKTNAFGTPPSATHLEH